MNTNHIKIHFTSHALNLFYSQSIIYENLTWLQTSAFTLISLVPLHGLQTSRSTQDYLKINL